MTVKQFVTVFHSQPTCGPGVYSIVTPRAVRRQLLAVAASFALALAVALQASPAFAGGGGAPPPPFHMTTAQRTAIASPGPGMLVYDTTAHTLQYWNGSAWVATASITNNVGGSTGQLQFNSGGSFAGWSNVNVDPSSGAMVVNYPVGAEHDLFFTHELSMNGSSSEERPQEEITTTTLTANTIHASFGVSELLSLNSNGFFLTNTGGGGQPNVATHSAGNLMAAHLADTTVYTPGCTPGVNCPGGVDGLNAGEGQCDNAGTGDVLFCRSFLFHSPQSLLPGGMIERWYGAWNDGCLPGVNAEQCYLLISSNTRNPIGIGVADPEGGVHVNGADFTTTGSGDINTATVNGVATGVMCLTSPVAGGVKTGAVSGAGIVNGALVTAAGVAAATHMVRPAPYDQSRDRYCYYLDTPQTVTDGTTFTFLNYFPQFLAQTFDNTTRPGYYFDITHNNTSGWDMQLAEGADQTLGGFGEYGVFVMNGVDTLYYTAFGSGRGPGIGVGYTELSQMEGKDFPYNLRVASLGIVTDGGYAYGGTPPTINPATGCGPTTVVQSDSGAEGGHYKATGACSGVNNFVQIDFQVTTVTPNGHHCSAHDITTPTNLIVPTAYSARTVTFTGNMVSGDDVTFACMDW